MFLPYTAQVDSISGAKSCKNCLEIQLSLLVFIDKSLILENFLIFILHVFILVWSEGTIYYSLHNPGY